MQSSTTRGMSLIDVIVGTSIMLIVFLSIFGSFKIAINLIYSTKAKTGAVALVADRLEYIRGLPYGSVGTVGGIPPGTVAQLATSSLNGITYTMRTLISYVDDPADGSGDDDENSITADYKTVKVEANWMIRASSRSTFAVTTVAPVGIETLAAGGTLRVNAIDALAAPVPGASVRIVNASVAPAIDVTAFANTAGSVSFPGAPAGGGYQITVSKSGYSTAKTYSSTVENPNPSPGHVAVANQLTSTLSLAIDLMGALHTYTYSPAGSARFNDTFTNQSKLSATSTTQVFGGELTLEGTGGVYVPEGNARSIPIAPAYLASWGSFSATSSVPAGTSLVFRLYSVASSVPTLIPDTDLPGNAAGFASPMVNLSALPIATYPSLALGAFLETASSTLTPSLLDWSLSYIAGPTPLPGVGMSIRSAKTIGTTAGGVPIYKYTGAFTTASPGDWLIDPIEWDTYTLVPTGLYDVMERCPNDVVVLPGATAPLAVTVVAHTATSLKIYVTGSGAALTGASVALGRSGATTTQTTSACGQAFYAGLAGGEYTLEISQSGFQTSIQPVTVSGTAEVNVPLSP